MTAAELGGRLGLHRLSRRDRRAIRLGLLVLAPALLWVGVVRPYRQAWTDTQDRLEAERALLVREQALIRDAAELPVEAREAGMKADRARRRMVEAASATLAEDELTNELEALAVDSRVLLEEMRSIEPTASELPESIQSIRLAIRGQSDLNGVSTFLRRMEEHWLLIRVEELSIQPEYRQPERNQRGRNDEPAGPAQPTGVMEFALIVEAYAAAGSFADAPGEVGT